MKKWNNAELVSIEISSTANGNNDWDREAEMYKKNYYGRGEDLRKVVGPAAVEETEVTTDSLS